MDASYRVQTINGAVSFAGNKLGRRGGSEEGMEEPTATNLVRGGRCAEDEPVGEAPSREPSAALRDASPQRRAEEEEQSQRRRRRREADALPRPLYPHTASEREKAGGREGYVVVRRHARTEREKEMPV